MIVKGRTHLKKNIIFSRWVFYFNSFGSYVKKLLGITIIPE